MLFFRDSVPNRRNSSVEDSRPARIERTTCIRSTQCVWISCQLIVFSPGGPEQLVDVRVADVRCVTVEREVLPVPDPGQQLEPEQVRERGLPLRNAAPSDK